MAEKQIVNGELESLKQLLQNYPYGVMIENIEANTTLDLPRRTLQRRLAELEKAGDIRVEGNTRAAKYIIERPIPYSMVSETREEEPIPLSSEGRRVQELTFRPLRQRESVGYRREFIDAYEPNVTQYLSDKDLERLAWLGRTGMPSQAAGTYAKQILSRLLIDLSWNSSRLEGNTYSLLDTQVLISLGESADDKSTAETQMILNHKDAIEFLVEATDDIGFNRYTLLNLHALLSNNLMADRRSPGRLRSSAVGIHQSVYVPTAIPQLIGELFDLILKKAAAIENPFEQAFFIMVHLPYLQPFDDVNKRVSRIAANIPLFRHNLSPISYIDVPNDLYVQGIIGVYESNNTALLRDVFMWAYERSAHRYATLRQSLGEPDLFRLKYREDMRMLIGDIISKAMSQRQAVKKIKTAALQFPVEDQAKFIVEVETELISMHEGNFARYRIRPSQFASWKSVWDTSNK